MKGKGDVKTYWLLGHVSGEVHRRDSSADFCQPALFPLEAKKKSPKMPRKGSLLTFKDDVETCSINANNSRIPAFLRLKAQDSNTSVHMSSLKASNTKLNRSSTLRLRTTSHNADCDPVRSVVHQQEKPRFIKTSASSNNMIAMANHFFDVPDVPNKLSGLVPLMSDQDNNLASENCEQQVTFQTDSTDSLAEKKAFQKSLFPAVKIHDSGLSKKWHSCSEIGCSSNRCPPSKFVNSSTFEPDIKSGKLRDWFLDLLHKRKTHNASMQTSSSQRYDSLMLNPIKENECGSGVESSV